MSRGWGLGVERHSLWVWDLSENIFREKVTYTRDQPVIDQRQPLFLRPKLRHSVFRRTNVPSLLCVKVLSNDTHFNLLTC